MMDREAQDSFVLRTRSSRGLQSPQPIRPIMYARQLTLPDPKNAMFDFPATETNLSNFVDSRSIADSGSPDFIETHSEHPRMSTTTGRLDSSREPWSCKLAHPEEIGVPQNEYHADYSTQLRSVYQPRVTARHWTVPASSGRASSWFWPGGVEEVWPEIPRSLLVVTLTVKCLPYSRARANSPSDQTSSTCFQSDSRGVF